MNNNYGVCLSGSAKNVLSVEDQKILANVYGITSEMAYAKAREIENSPTLGFNLPLSWMNQQAVQGATQGVTGAQQANTAADLARAARKRERAEFWRNFGRNLASNFIGSSGIQVPQDTTTEVSQINQSGMMANNQNLLIYGGLAFGAFLLFTAVKGRK